MTKQLAWDKRPRRSRFARSNKKEIFCLFWLWDDAHDCHETVAYGKFLFPHVLLWQIWRVQRDWDRFAVCSPDLSDDERTRICKRWVCSGTITSWEKLVKLVIIADLYGKSGDIRCDAADGVFTSTDLACRTVQRFGANTKLILASSILLSIRTKLSRLPQGCGETPKVQAMAVVHIDTQGKIRNCCSAHWICDLWLPEVTAHIMVHVSPHFA